MTYDLIVIGSGPGGYSAAIRGGQYGLKTALIEKAPKLGGTCLHVGCIPTKALLHTAEVWDHFQHSQDEGILCENPRLDFKLVNDRKSKIVNKHAKGVEMLMKKNKVEVIRGFGILKGGGKVDVRGDDGSTKTLEAKNILLATGSEARMLPGLEPDPDLTKALCAGAHTAGVIVLSCGTFGNVLRFLPPLTISDDLLVEGLDVLALVLADL